MALRLRNKKNSCMLFSKFQAIFLEKSDILRIFAHRIKHYRYGCYIHTRRTPNLSLWI